MAEYTQAVELHIAKTLDLRGVINSQMLPGVEEMEAAEILRRYAELHSQRQRLDFDGKELRLLRPPSRQMSDELPASRPSNARWFLVGGVLTIALIAVAFAGFARSGVRPSAAWPASPDGRAALYYFGTST